VRQDFLLKRATNHITGYVKDNLSNPIIGVGVYAHATINGTNFNAGNATTDGNGNYSLNVVNGTWQVGVNCGCSDCSDNLTSKGYQCVNNQQVSISGNNGVANFIAQPCGALQITTTTLPNATVGSYYNGQSQASGCQQPFQWSLSPGSGPLPSGLNLDSGGNLSGTPNSSGTFNFSVRVTDNTSDTADKALSIIVNPGLQVTTTSLPNGTSGLFYSQQLQATGGQPPYTWYLPGGSVTLPPGMDLSMSGVLSGTPGATGVSNFQVAVYVNNPYQQASQWLSLTINTGSSPLQVTTTSLPNGTNGTFYTQQLQASGGQTPYSWRVPDYSANLPANLTLATNGVLSGTPALNGTFYFAVEVDDAATNAAYQTLSLTIVNPPLPPLLITNASLPSGNVGAAYSAQLGATGGQSPYTWSLATGSANPPPGLTLDSSGLISGTPTTNKVATFKVQAMDANFTATNKILSITINPKPLLGSPSWLTNQFQMRLTGASNQNYTVQMSTNLSSTNWISLFITNNTTTNSFLLTDPNATNNQRFYRILIGP
jgi:hypothetical protein